MTGFGGSAEKFVSTRGANNSAAHVVVCSYEHAADACLLIQNLYEGRRLSGIFFNEAHQLNPWLVDFRDFDPVPELLSLLTGHNVVTSIIFMTATLRHPERILEFCGLSKSEVTYYCLPPIRDNVKFEVQLLNGSTRDESNKKIMATVVAAIKMHAQNERAVIFVMYKYQVEAIAATLRTSFPDRVVVEYDSDRKPDVTNLAPSAIVVATSALKTGTNMSETNLAILHGGAYSLEDLIQAAGRTGRYPGSEGRCIVLCTPHSFETAIRVSQSEKEKTGEARIQEVISILKAHPGVPVEQSLRDAFPTEFRPAVSAVLSQSQQQTQRRPLPANELVHIVHRALQVSACTVRCCVLTLTRSQNRDNLRSSQDDQERCYSCLSSDHYSSDCSVEADVSSSV